MAFKYLFLDHVGIAVDDLAKTKEVFVKLGLTHKPEDEFVEEQGVRVSFFPIGTESELEFLESTTPDGPIARYIASNGGKNGLQHICIRVDNIRECLKDLKEKGIRLLDEEPRYGAGGMWISFIHPKSTNGILVELCEPIKK